MRLYIIRHGEVDVNVKNQINGINDSVLTTKGVNQAIEAGEKIRNIDIDLIICSTLKRAKQTCQYINVNNVPVIYDERLVERDGGTMMYQSIDVLDYSIWYDSTKELVFENSEGFKSICNRVFSVLEEVKEKYSSKSVLLVCHGDITRAIYYYFNRNATTDELRYYEQGNCGIREYNL